MDRCPNCDAAVRANAKFCTSCGFRLPTPEPAKQPDQWRSPFATTSNYEHNQSWTAPVAPPPAPPSPPPAQAEPAPTPPAQAAPEPSAPAEPAPVDDAAPVFAGWPNFSTSTIPPGEPIQAEAPTEPVAQEAEAPAPSETREPASAIDEDGHAQELDDLARQYDERHGKNGGNQPFAWAAALTETPEPQAESEPEPEPAPTVPTAEVAAADEPTEPISALAAQPASDAAERAMNLLDELRSLIPSLGASAHSGSAVVRSILVDANVPSNDSGDLEQLRTAIDTANARPRDIDVMLDLVSRAGAIRDVLVERDRFAEAISRALAATEGSKE